MKRNLDLIRRILFAIEVSQDDEPASIDLNFADVDELHISHHVRLLQEAGFIHAIQRQGFNTRAFWIPHSITWRGHDFLSAIRDESVWRRVKARAKLAGEDFPAELVYELALEELKTRLRQLAATAA